MPVLDPEHTLELRLRGAVDLARSRPPSEAEELWRYSGIDRFDASKFSSSNDPSTVVASVVDLPASAAASGVRVENDTDVAVDPEFFDALGVAHSASRIVIRVPANAELAEPIRITTTLSASGTAGTSVRVVLGVNSSATVIEEFRSDTSGREAALLVARTVLDLGDGSRLRHASVQLVDEKDWFVGSLVAVTRRDATLSSVAVALGGAYARLETTARATPTRRRVPTMPSNHRRPPSRAA